MLLASLYRFIEEQIDNRLSLKNSIIDFEALYKFIKDEVKSALHFSVSQSYAYQFDILPKHLEIQNTTMIPFYIVVNDNGSGSMLNESGDVVYKYNHLSGDDAFAAIAVYKNCFLYKTTLITLSELPKKK